MGPISVVIPTFKRPHLLKRAIASVEHQDYPGELEIIVVTAEQDYSTLSMLSHVVGSSKLRSKLCTVSFDTGAVRDNLALTFYVPARIAFQRNVGIAAARGEFIAHLDDDNEYLSNHLSSLMQVFCRFPEAQAVHSWRRILRQDGTPFTRNLYPWLKQPKYDHARFIYNELVRLGVFEHNSCLVRDRLISPSGERLLTVDSSEWLIRRDFHLQFRFKEKPQFREISHALSDDYLFSLQLADAGIKVKCSGQFTVNYYLGGQSSQWLKEVIPGGRSRACP